jgi:hypothetical protein
VENSNTLDQLKLEAARIVTGLPIVASSILIYRELGWESMTERRKGEHYKSFIIYKIIMYPSLQNVESIAKFKTELRKLAASSFN